MIQFHKKSVNRDYGALGHKICFVIGENLKKQALVKKFQCCLFVLKKVKFKI